MKGQKMELKIDDITEEWVRENIDIEERRSVIHSYLNSYDIADLFGYTEKEVTFDEFIKLLQDKVDETKERFSNINGKLSVTIKREHGYDECTLRMIITEVTPEDDMRLIKRIIQSERQKIRRKAAKKRTDEHVREKELAEYRRLRKKYGKVV